MHRICHTNMSIKLEDFVREDKVCDEAIKEAVSVVDWTQV